MKTVFLLCFFLPAFSYGQYYFTLSGGPEVMREDKTRAGFRFGAGIHADSAILVGLSVGYIGGYGAPYFPALLSFALTSNTSKGVFPVGLVEAGMGIHNKEGAIVGGRRQANTTGGFVFYGGPGVGFSVGEKNNAKVVVNAGYSLHTLTYNKIRTQVKGLSFRLNFYGL